MTAERSAPIGELSFAPVGPSEARSRRLREDLLGTWVAVTEAGGAVGFTPPVDVAEVASTLDRALHRVAAGCIEWPAALVWSSYS